MNQSSQQKIFVVRKAFEIAAFSLREWKRFFFLMRKRRVAFMIDPKFPMVQRTLNQFIVRQCQRHWRFVSYLNQYIFPYRMLSGGCFLRCRRRHRGYASSLNIVSLKRINRNYHCDRLKTGHIELAHGNIGQMRSIYYKNDWVVFVYSGDFV